MQLILSNNIKIRKEQLPQSVFTQIQQDLTFDNPAYKNALKNGKRTFGLPKSLSMLAVDDDYYFLPRGYLNNLTKHLSSKGVSYIIKDETLTLPHQEFGSVIRLRDYQKEAVLGLLSSFQGGAESGCGSGKTIILTETMARIGQPSLWVVPTIAIMQDAINTAQIFLSDVGTIGQIGDGKFTIGEKMTVATIDTLAKRDLSDLINKFGAIFVDEAHHLPAKTYKETISQFPAKYLYWCSATPYREDGLGPMMFASAGPTLHKVDPSVVPTIKPEIVVVETKYDGVHDEYHKLLQDIINNSARNDLLVSTINQEVKEGNYLLVLSDRIQHLEILQQALKKNHPDLNIEVLKGSPKKERNEVLARAKMGKVDILLATQIAREGLDIPHLNRLFLVTPKKASAAIQQEVGRIMRPSQGKKDAVVYDFWDSKCPIVKGQFWSRRRVYRKLSLMINMPKQKK